MEKVHNMKYLSKSIKDINKLLRDGKIKPIDLVNEAIENIENKDIKNSLIMMLKHTAERKK